MNLRIYSYQLISSRLPLPTYHILSQPETIFEKLSDDFLFHIYIVFLFSLDFCINI